jgi:hypothetical protein
MNLVKFFFTLVIISINVTNGLLVISRLGGSNLLAGSLLIVATYIENQQLTGISLEELRD